MSETVLWRVTSRVHDWNDGQFLSAVIRTAVDVGIIERADWIATEAGGERQPVRLDGSDELLRKLVGQLPKQARVRYVEAGGEAPAPWSIQLMVPPFDARERRVDGMGIVALLFDGKRFENAEGSTQLAEAFRSVHTPENTEYSGIHWFERWTQLNNSSYDPAVTYTPMFSGAVWANFLGHGHIEQFDKSRLLPLPASETTWLGDRGLFLVLSMSLAEARSEAAEAALSQRTAIFRNALRE